VSDCHLFDILWSVFVGWQQS